jgi:UDP-N-acetylmuramoyl-L-alanyl-D-glutamate--2,6-diaminopimelate ligase
MKRSEINEILKNAKTFLADHKFMLPPWAYWGLTDWQKAQKEHYREIIDNMLGMEEEEVLRVLTLLTPVAGRFETIRSAKGITAIVDYAHTPDALTNVLEAIHEVLQGKGKLLTVVGCGGNRDRAKRPLMAIEAVRLSDRALFTSDNPRFEEPEAILQDMLDGLSEEQQAGVLTIVDRREAIKTACMLAKPGDVVLIAGKGHEDYQEVKGVRYPFDDRVEVEKLFHAL